METWDLLDSERRPLRRTHRRGTPLGAGEYHTEVEVWTVRGDGQVLLTLRDPAKREYPGKWENTAGCALAGETSRQAAVRELREETGIRAGEEELLLLGVCQEDTAFVDVYLLRRDIPLQSLTLQPGETTDAQWVSVAALDAMIADQSFALPMGLRLAQVRAAFDACLAGP